MQQREASRALSGTSRMPMQPSGRKQRAASESSEFHAAGGLRRAAGLHTAGHYPEELPATLPTVSTRSQVKLTHHTVDQLRPS